MKYSIHYTATKPKPITAPPLTSEMKHMIQYWNGSAWRRENHEYLGESADQLIKMGMARVAGCQCGLLGHRICTCASSRYRDETSFSRPIGESIYSLHRPERNFGHTGWPHLGFMPPPKLDVEDIVDKWLLLPGDIEIEASL